ncbi:MAG: T9SS type A sorting domain-containing protein [Bacteroidota bacterium]
MHHRATIILTFLWAFSTVPLFGQAWEWVDQIGGTNSENMYAINSTLQGTTYVLGTTEASFISPDGPLPTFGGFDVLLTQLDEFGTVNWIKTAGSTDNDLPGGLVGLSDGSAVIAGRYWDEATFGDEELIISQGSSSGIFVVKYLSDGTVDWAKGIDGAGIKVVNQIERDQDDNFYICGYFGDTLFTELGNLTSPANTAAYILKYDPAGNLLWANSYGSTFDTRATSITLDGNSNVYVAGDSNGSFEFDGEIITTPTVDNDVFLMKLDAVGNELWVNRYGGGLEDNATGVAAQPNGQVFLTGKFIGLFDIGGTTLQTQGFNDNIYLCSISDLGVTLWAKSLGSTSFETTTGISAFGSEFAISGFYQGTTDIDGFVLSSGPTESNAFMAIFDESGAVNIVEDFQGPGFDLAVAIDYDPAGGILTAGQFESGITTGGFNLTSSGGFDIFMGRWLFVSSVSGPLALRQIGAYPNPAQSEVFLELDHTTRFPVEVQVVDALGRSVQFLQLNGPSFSVDTWASGVYFLRGEDWIVRLVKP